MKKIRALQQFSHFHAGTFDQGESRSVDDDIAEALVGMKLAEHVDADDKPEPVPPEKQSALSKKK